MVEIPFFAGALAREWKRGRLESCHFKRVTDWFGSSGVSYRLEASADGETWHPVAAPVQGVDRTAARSTLALTPPDIAAGKMLHRLVLTLRESSVDTQ